MSATMSFAIAIDGLAGSGKGTLSRALAKHYGFPCLHTGLLYRAVAKAVLDGGGGGGEDIAQAVQAAKQINLKDLDEATLHQAGIGALASQLATAPAVRDALRAYQRQFAAGQFAASAAGVILEGRDIGTIILPQAQVKFFITAKLEIRAERRYRQLGGAQTLEALHAELAERDQRDQTRATAPLKKASDAHLLDTGKRDIIGTTNQAIQIIDAAKQQEDSLC